MPWGWWGRRSSRLCSTGCCWCCSCCWRGGRRWRWCAASAGGCSRSGGRPAAGSPLPARVCWTPGKRVGLVRRRRAGVGRSDRTEPNRTGPDHRTRAGSAVDDACGCAVPHWRLSTVPGLVAGSKPRSRRLRRASPPTPSRGNSALTSNRPTAARPCCFRRRRLSAQETSFRLPIMELTRTTWSSPTSARGAGVPGQPLSSVNIQTTVSATGLPLWQNSASARSWRAPQGCSAFSVPEWSLSEGFATLLPWGR